MRIKQEQIMKVLLGIGFVFVFTAGIFKLDDIPVVANIFNSSVEPKFQVNQNGETYGSLAYVNTPGKEPDLVFAKGEGEIEGYLKLRDMWGEQPNNPEEAIAYMNKQKEEKASGHKYIPLYASDGKTVIGKFKVW